MLESLSNNIVGSILKKNRQMAPSENLSVAAILVFRCISEEAVCLRSTK